MESVDPSFENAACGLIVASVDGMIRRVNPTFCSWIGRPADALVGKVRLQDLFTIGAKIYHQTHWAPMLQMHGSLSEVKLDVTLSNGSALPVLFNVVRRQSDDDAWDDIAAMVVSDRSSYEKVQLEARRAAEAAQAALTRLDKQKDRFLATMSHELRNPLAPITNVVEVLKLQDLDDSTVKWARKILTSQVAQLSRLVDDLLEAARITQGKIRLQIVPVVLANALDVAVQGARPFIDAAGHALELHDVDPAIRVMADPTRITQMLVNILNNSAKYTPDGGRISVAVTTTDSAAMISIRDTGIGMTADDIGHVFQMFNQVAPAVNRSDGGLGIGLALVKSLAEMHGGSITAQSDGLELGSEFVLTLPLVAGDG